MKLVSVIITHYADNNFRSNALKKTLESLIGTIKNLPVEIIVVENGGRKGDTEYLLNLLRDEKIAVYVKNQHNMHFGYARNQGLRLSNGEYIVISDNDIIYNPGWLETCIGILEKYSDEKIYATPIYNVAHWRPKYWSPKTLEYEGRIVRLNRRAGSNCFVMRRKDFEEIGDFWVHRVAGTKFTNKAGALGYWAAVTPDIMVNDWGFRKGYSLNKCLPVYTTLTNGEKVYWNEDEFRNEFKDNNYMKQKSFKVDER